MGEIAGWRDLPFPTGSVRPYGACRNQPEGWKLDLGGKTLYLDESGGEDADDERIRRCGWGLAFLGEGEKSFSFQGGWSAPLLEDEEHPP